MPRANRHFVPGHYWHITHRCHEQSFLLKFSRDRRCYIRWLFEAKKRFGLCLLNYAVTCNHVHLLVRDSGSGVISDSIQLLAGRMAQEYNLRKARRGAFWEDRYHATAVESGEHLQRCIVYIDLNMVRAGVVRHPADWRDCGYREIQNPPERYGLVDLCALSAGCGFGSVSEFRRMHARWVTHALADVLAPRDPRWTRGLAVGSHAFVDRIWRQMGLRAKDRRIYEEEGIYNLREPRTAYTCDLMPQNEVLRAKRSYFSATSDMRSDG
jgi:putative transposase